MSAKIETILIWGKDNWCGGACSIAPKTLSLLVSRTGIMDKISWEMIISIAHTNWSGVIGEENHGVIALGGLCLPRGTWEFLIQSDKIPPSACLSN